MSDAYAAIQPIPIIDSFGNINLQGRGGQVFNFSTTASTDDLTPINIDGFSYRFEIDGYASVSLARLTPTSKTLTLPNGLYGIPLNTPVYWALLDVTGTPTLPLRSGLLTVYGFEAAPP